MRDAEGGGELDPGQVMDLGQDERVPLAGRDGVQGSLHLRRQAPVHRGFLGGAIGPARLAGPGDEADDASPTELVQRGPAGDLIKPGAGAGRVLECFEGAVGLDEGFLGQVSGQLVVAEHARQVGVDLAGMEPEELLDDGSRGGSIAGHGSRPPQRGVSCEQ